MVVKVFGREMSQEDIHMVAVNLNLRHLKALWIISIILTLSTGFAFVMFNLPFWQGAFTTVMAGLVSLPVECITMFYWWAWVHRHDKGNIYYLNLW